ncbi:MAG: DUF1269 domain-containing protein [Caldilineaceae bacterium]
MSQLLVITFEGAHSAAEVRETLGRMQRDGLLRVQDAAVITAAEDGTFKVDNEISRNTKVGAGWGAAFGLILTFVFPVAGLIAGTASGALIGSMLESGVDKSFINDVKASMAPGTSALFVAADNVEPAAMRAALANHNGRLLQTTLDDNTADQLRAALGEK